MFETMKLRFKMAAIINDAKDLGWITKKQEKAIIAYADHPDMLAAATLLFRERSMLGVGYGVHRYFAYLSGLIAELEVLEGDVFPKIVPESDSKFGRVFSDDVEEVSDIFLRISALAFQDLGEHTWSEAYKTAGVTRTALMAFMPDPDP